MHTLTKCVGVNISSSDRTDIRARSNIGNKVRIMRKEAVLQEHMIILSVHRLASVFQTPEAEREEADGINKLI